MSILVRSNMLPGIKLAVLFFTPERIPINRSAPITFYKNRCTFAFIEGEIFLFVRLVRVY